MVNIEKELDIITRSAGRSTYLAMMDAYDRVLEILNNKTEMICKVMDSQESQTIFYSSSGNNFRRLNAKRNELWAKRFLIQNILSKVWDERKAAYEEYQKYK